MQRHNTSEAKDGCMNLLVENLENYEIIPIFISWIDTSIINSNI